MAMFHKANVIFLLSFLFIISSDATTNKRCRCLANNPLCWPNATTWQSFNVSVNGRLRAPKSSATPCTLAGYNAALCSQTFYNWINSTWRSDQIGATQYFNWENSSCSIFVPSSVCTQGSIPVLGVDAVWPEHVITTLKFVTNYNLRLVIKTTGHDLLGRSTAYGSVLLWLHHMKNMTLIPSYRTCKGKIITNAVRVSAGVQWGDVYAMLKDHGLTALGGASGSVAAAGGYIQGGGHSILSRWGGMPTDQVLEYDVITVDGKRLTVSPCQEPDLYWALSGGGPSSYAIVISVVLRTFQSPVIVGTLQTIKAPNQTRYQTLIRDFFRKIPSLADAGMAGYFSMQDTTLTIILIWPNGDLNSLNQSVTQFYMNNMDLNFTQSIVGSLPTFYDFYLTVLSSLDYTGYDGFVGSRLLPASIVRNKIDAVSSVFLQMNGESQKGSQLSINLVAGGKASDTSLANNSVNPLWRSALLHVYYGQGWTDLASQATQDAVASNIASKTQLLDTLSNSTLFGCYMNEADPNEPRWQERFFGSMTQYNRLKSVKQRYDPNGILICKKCVGSDDWSADLNCHQ